MVEVEEGKTMEITIEHKQGMILDKGYASAYFVTDSDTMEAEIKNPYILVTDQKISSIQDLLPLLEQFMKVSKDLVIIAEDVDGEALTTIVLNKLRGTFNILAVKAPGFGDRKKEMLQDIAILTGANLVSADTGRQLKDASMEDLGKADTVRSTKDETVIVGGKGSKSDINGRIAQIDAQVEKTKSDFDKEKLVERKAKLTGGVAVIQVGASTEIEMKNLQERVKDAKGALKAAIEEGIIPGGGVTYIQAAKALKKVTAKDPDEQMGIDLVREVLEEPLRMLAQNSGANSGEVIYKIKEKDDPSYGYDVMTGVFGDMVKAGVIEPAKVEIAALQ
ncbi:MAG: chaperonin GroEL, partial [Patescibacteria group bacterium]|nr:chaperonin GroEL [Patescibacteria group bacterium]